VSNPAEALEHIEHNAHSTSRFDKKVAVTVAIIAALMATMHSFETESQAESLKYEIEAGKEQTSAANAWSYYQAKNIRDHMYESMEELSSIVPAQDPATREKAIERWRKQRDKYKSELKENMEEARKREKKSEELHHQSEAHHRVANRTGRATLLLELGIVITSLAVLTRKRSFWLVGGILATIGAIYGGYVVIAHLLAGH
jgi:thiamine pyrophosphate-dependent acetolactate synthase large subunit-like protein